MRRLTTLAATLSVAVALLVSVAAAQDPGTTREFAIIGGNYAFAPTTIEVNRNDLVKISFTAHEIPHSFTIDEYRIAKRANADQTVTFEFRADRPGTFAYYCNLSQDARCRNMKGRLVVK